MASGRKRKAATKTQEDKPEEMEVTQTAADKGSEQDTRTKEEIPASLDAEQAKAGGADYWDLDDDGDWGGSGQSSASKHRRILRRSDVEIGIAFVCHLLLMCFYIFVHTYDATIFKRSKGVGFEGHFTYGGRWKYLTYLNTWIQFLYFFLCFFVDIMPYGATKVWFRKMCDLLFSTVALPLSIFVAVMFWSIYAIDRELIYPLDLDKTIPFELNHLWHTTIVVCVLIELVVVFHQFPSNWTAALVTFTYSFGYMLWIIWVFTVSHNWPYPFFNLIPPPLLPVFFLVCSLVGLLFYFLGKGLCYLRWPARHQVLAELSQPKAN